MTTYDRDNFYAVLDSLADVLQVPRQEQTVKDELFYSLRGFSLQQIVRAAGWLRDNFKTYGRFPIPLDFHGAIESTHDDTYSGESRTVDQVKEEYKRRGMLIGDEAVEAMERQTK